MEESLARSDLSNYAPASNLSLNEKIRNLIQGGKCIYHFAFGQSPFPVLDTAVDALKEHAGENAYLPVAGLPELRQAISQFHKTYDGIQSDMDDIIVGPGSKELVFLLLNIFQGDVIVISPSWTTYKPQARLAHHEPHVIETSLDSEWKITPKMLKSFLEEKVLKKNKILILNNPDNPTGTSYTETELIALSEVFRQHDIIVLSDEIYGRLSYDQNHISIAKFCPERTILSTGLSKWASAGGWRVGYHIYPPELSSLRDAVRSAASHTYSCAPAPMQYAAIKMFSDFESCDNYIKHCSRILKSVGTYCYSELTSVGVRAVKPKAGYYIFPDFEVVHNKLRQRGLESGQDMCNTIFEEISVALMSGGPAFLRPEDELTTRLCFVPFDGGKALEASRQIGLQTPLPPSFVKEYCTPVYDGIQLLKAWVVKNS